MSEVATSMAGRQSAAGATRYTQAELNRFIDAHERFVRRQPNGRRLSLMYLQAQDMDFSGRDLTEADFTGSNLQGARLMGAKLERANLFCADLNGADVREADLRRADIRGVSLRNANLAGSNMDEADMREAMLARADVANGFALAGRSAQIADQGQEIVFAVDFSNCSMKRARMANARMKNANFSGAILQGCDMRGASMLGARFDGAVVDGADMTGARMDANALKRAVASPSYEALERAEVLRERLQSAELWMASNGREGAAAVLDDEDLRTVEDALAGRPLTAMSARRACAIGVSFAGSQLQGVRFDGADLREADFTGADLRGASFRGANLRHARFDRADVRPLAMASGMREVALDGANVADDCFAKALTA